MICSTQATSHKPQAIRLGFTLSELLVSLAVLGLIAGLTVPSIVVAVDKSKTKTTFKEAVQLVASTIQAGYLNGDFQSITDWNYWSNNGSGDSSIVGYFSQRFNATKQCLTADIASAGCVRGYSGAAANSSNNTHNARWILPTGAKVQLYGGFNTYANSTYLLWTITAKAYANDMTTTGSNPDTSLLLCNISDSTISPSNVAVKPGTCGAWDTNWKVGLDALTL